MLESPRRYVKQPLPLTTQSLGGSRGKGDIAWRSFS